MPDRNKLTQYPTPVQYGVQQPIGRLQKSAHTETDERVLSLSFCREIFQISC